MENFNYDLNIRDGKHKVLVTYGTWDFRATYETTINGNCKGASIIEAAIENFLEDTLAIIEDSGGFEEEDGGVWTYVMLNDAGERLTGVVFGTESECHRRISDMVLGVKIVAHEEDAEEVARQLAYRKKKAAEREVEKAASNGEIITEDEGHVRAAKALAEFLASFDEEASDGNE